MDKIKQFIKDNKGCPLTPAATKQLLVKFMEFMKDKLPDMIQKGGIAFDKQYIFVDDEVQVVDAIPEDYGGASYWFGTDGYLYIEQYYNGEQKSTIEIEYDDLNIKGIHFSQKATVWEVDDDFDSLGSFLEENASKLKAGDIIASFEDGYVGTIESYGELDSIYIRSLQEEIVVLYEYLYNDGWSLGTQTETPIGGTKLYKHIIVIDDTAQSTFTLITTQSSLDLEESFLTNLDSLFDAGILISINCAGTLSQLIYDYDYSQLLYFTESGISSISVEYDIVSDTVTPL